MSFPFPATERLLHEALETNQGSALAMLVTSPTTMSGIFVGKTAQPGSGGCAGSVGPNSLFDLASLTKILCTAPILIDAIQAHEISLADPVQKFFPEFPTSEVQIEHLIRHNSGLLAHEKYYERPDALARGYIEKAELIRWICASPLTPLAKANVVYSDLGMLLLGFILENIFGKTIAEIFEERVKQPLSLQNTGFRVLPHAPSAAKRFALSAPIDRFVATAICPFHKKLLQGEVDDNNCWGLGGYSAHAGLFSNLNETLQLMKFAVDKAKQFHDVFFPNSKSRPPFTRNFMLYPGLRPVPGNEWNGAIGHTGFVGTSAWYHEIKDTYIILLGNRVHPSREDTRFVETRLEIHRTLWAELNY